MASNKKKDTAVGDEEVIAEKPASQQEADWKVTVEYVGFYARVGAALIDTIAMMLPLSLLFAAIFETAWGGANYSDREAMLAYQAYGDPEKTRQVLQVMFSAEKLQRLATENLIFTACAGVLVVALWYFFSATPGKMLMGMKIVDAETGMPPHNGQNIIRYLGYFVSTIVCGLGLFWVMWQKRRQGWHDMMAGTVVVYKKSLPKEMAEATLSRQ